MSVRKLEEMLTKIRTENPAFDEKVVLRVALDATHSILETREMELARLRREHAFSEYNLASVRLERETKALKALEAERAAENTR